MQNRQKIKFPPECLSQLVDGYRKESYWIHCWPGETSGKLSEFSGYPWLWEIGWDCLQGEFYLYEQVRSWDMFQVTWLSKVIHRSVVAIWSLKLYLTVFATLCNPNKPVRLLGLWDFPGKNTGMDDNFLLQIFQTKQSNMHLPKWQADSLPLSHLGSAIRQYHFTKD